MVKKTKTENKKTKKTNSSSVKLKKLNSEIKDLKNSIVNLNEKNLRLMAEFENFKKRNNKILSDSYIVSVEKIIGSFLPVVDDIYRILKDDNNESQIAIDGISMVQKKIKKILSSYDVESFDSLSEIFNPDFHEAIMSQVSDQKENIIIEEFEKGYKIKDKIIRHSKVIVSKGKKWEITMKF